MLKPDGSGLIYSTYLGGGGTDSGKGILTDGTGASYIVGTTDSTDLATTAGAIQSSAGAGQFHSRMDFATSSCPTGIATGTIGSNFPRSLALANSNGTASAFINRPVAALSQTSVTFPNTYVGNVSSPVYVTLSNPSGASLSISQIAASGPFTESPSCAVPGTLYVGFSCPIGISFVPGSSTTFSGSVTITDNIQSGSQVITLSGNGTTSNLSLDKTSLDFGTQLVGVQSPGQTITVTSTGLSSLQFQYPYTSYTGPSAGDFNVSNSCYSVSPGNTCPITVYFTASGTTTENATLNILDNGPNSPQTVSLTGLATNPAPGGGSSNSMNFVVNNPAPSITSLSPSSVSTGTTDQTLTINGTGFLSTSTVTFNGVTHAITSATSTQLTIVITTSDQATAGSYALVVTNPVPGGGASNSVNFAVQNPSPSITSLTPSSVSAGTAAQTLAINGTGFVSTSSATFAGVAHTTTFVSSKKVTIQITAADQASVGSYPVVVTNSAPGGGTSNSESFAVVTPPAGPVVTLLPSGGLNFTGQTVGTQSASQPVALTNSGGSALLISTINISGGDSNDFARTHNCPISPSTLGTGMICTINVTFTPSAAKQRKTALMISSNAAGSPRRFMLTGLGSAIGVSPANLSFTSQQVGTTSDPQNLSVHSYGSAPVHVWSAGIDGANYSEFITTNSCPIPPAALAAGAICTIAVRFKPTSAGPKSAALLISHDGGESPSSVGMTGTAALLLKTQVADSPLLISPTISPGTTQTSEDEDRSLDSKRKSKANQAKERSEPQ